MEIELKRVQTRKWMERPMIIGIVVAIPLFLFIGLNFRQLYMRLAWSNEARLLERRAGHLLDVYANPAPGEDLFTDGLSSDFWDFMIINGAGKVSNASAWHAVEAIIQDGLILRHLPDPDFRDETSESRKPAAERYNNVTLIGGRGYQPTQSEDVVLTFTARSSESFYGSAGVVVQPMDTLQKDGHFTKPFDMFGFSVIGAESSLAEVSGPLCYLALNWAPGPVLPLQIDPSDWHTYELRLHRVNKIKWLGSIAVDGIEMCQIPMPAFGPVEVQVWSDNYLITSTPQQLWEISPALYVDFQDGGEKEVELKMIRIHTERISD